MLVELQPIDDMIHVDVIAGAEQENHSGRGPLDGVAENGMGGTPCLGLNIRPDAARSLASAALPFPAVVAIVGVAARGYGNGVQRAAPRGSRLATRHCVELVVLQGLELRVVQALELFEPLHVKPSFPSAASTGPPFYRHWKFMAGVPCLEVSCWNGGALRGGRQGEVCQGRARRKPFTQGCGFVLCPRSSL